MSDDEDEFGDFEEARFVDEKSVVDEEVVESQQYLLVGEPQESLQLLLSTPDLWNLETGNENVKIETNDHNVFVSFYTSTSGSNFPSDVNSALDVWSQLRIGEGVSALQFQWSTSKSWVQFVSALPLHFAQPINRVEYNFDETPEEGAKYVSLQSLSATNEYDLGKSSLNMNVEELNGSPSDSKLSESRTSGNAQSVLEQELGALGLGDDRNHSAKSSVPPTSNGLGSRGTTENSHKLLHQPRYLCVSDLSQEAQSFYEQMPDLHFMLANRVIGEW